MLIDSATVGSYKLRNGFTVMFMLAVHYFRQIYDMVNDIWLIFDMAEI